MAAFVLHYSLCDITTVLLCVPVIFTLMLVNINLGADFPNIIINSKFYFNLLRGFDLVKG